ALDGPGERSQVRRGDGPLAGGRAAGDDAAAFCLEAAAFQRGDHVGEAGLVALELGEPVLRLALARAVAGERGLVTGLELAQVGQLLRLLAAQALELLLV